MSGIQGIGGFSVPGVSNGLPRTDRNENATAGRDDEVDLSSEAQELAAAVKQSSAIREEAVARARENIEQGTFRLQKVVLEVAARITPYLIRE